MKMPVKKQSDMPGEYRPPRLLINSILAAIPVIFGFILQNLFVYGQVQATSYGLCLFIAGCILLTLWWNRIRSNSLVDKIAIVVVSGQWLFTCWALFIAYSEFFEGPGLWIRMMALGFGIVAIVAILLGDFRSDGFANTFTTLSIISTALILWAGLEVWTVQIRGLPKSAGSESNKVFGLRTAEENNDQFRFMKQKRGDRSENSEIWSYQGETGPEIWGALNNNFKSCSYGSNQSPVDIPQKTGYSFNELQIRWLEEPAQLINSGFTIQASLSGKSITRISGRDYYLKQLHFHTPSEHQVSGLSYPIEIHFVHSSADGKVAILAVFAEIGQSHNEYGKIFSVMPQKVKDTPLSTGLVNLEDLLPRVKKIYQYQGSLTTPPCSEGVLWSIFASPIELSMDQITLFRKLYPNNARPIQVFGGRKFESNFSTIAH